MGVNGVGGGTGRFNTWNFNELMNGTATRQMPKKAKQGGSVSLYAGNNTALSGGLPQDQTKAFAANYSKAFFAGLERQKQTEKAQNTGKKDPEYNHKKFTSKLKNAKSPQAIRSLAASIRATIADLKAKQATGEYDEEEIAAAILHAEIMEQAALKRADNLEQEEMAERKLKREELEELMEGEKEEEGAMAVVPAEGDPASVASAEAETEEMMDAEMQAMMEEMQRLQEEMAAQMAEEMEEMLAEASEEDPLQALDDMSKILSGSVSEEDIDEMKKKHRAAEDMTVARADMEYLKMKFNRLQRQRDALKSGAAGFGKGAQGNGGAVPHTAFTDGAGIVAGAVKSAQITAAHHAASSSAPSVSSSGGASAPAAGGSIDISG